MVRPIARWLAGVGLALPAAGGAAADPPAPPRAVVEPAAPAPVPVLVRQTLPPAVTAGRGFAAEVQVTNAGDRPVDETFLSGSWSPSHTLGESTPPPMRSVGRPTWLLGRLGPGETQTVRLTFVPADGPADAAFRSEFEVTYRAGRSDAQAVPVHKPAGVDLAVSAPPVAVVGQPVTVQVAVRNPNAADLRGLTLSSTIPPGLTHPRGPDLEAALDVVPAGRTESVPLVVTPTQAGVVRTVFRVAGDGVPAVEKELNLFAVEGKLELDLRGPKELPHGWPGTYELTVRNAGQQPAAGVQVQVQVPAGFDDLRATAGARFDPAGRKLLWLVGELPPGEKRTLVWLAVAKAAGDQPITASALLGTVPCQSTEWRTTVQPAGR